MKGCFDRLFLGSRWMKFMLFNRAVLTMVCLLPLLFFVGCKKQYHINMNSTAGGIPLDIKHQQYERYKTIDDVVNAFQEAGSSIRRLEYGNIVDIPFTSSQVRSLFSIREALEKSCLNMMGDQGRPRRGDNLRSSWYYLLYDGGPIVNFDSEVSRVESLVRGSSLNNWATPKSASDRGNYLCSIYEKKLFPGYEKEMLQKPLFLAIERCEYEKNEPYTPIDICHWIIVRTPNLLDIVKQTRINSEALLVEREEQYRKSEEEYRIRRKQELEQNAIRAKDERSRVKTIGAKICHSSSGVGKEYSGIVIGGIPSYSKYTGEIMITAFTESVSNNRIQVRVVGIDFFGEKSFRLDETGYNSFVIQNGSVIWDDVDNWRPCIIH